MTDVEIQQCYYKAALDFSHDQRALRDWLDFHQRFWEAAFDRWRYWERLYSDRGYSVFPLECFHTHFTVKKREPGMHVILYAEQFWKGLMHRRITRTQLVSLR